VKLEYFEAEECKDIFISIVRMVGKFNENK